MQPDAATESTVPLLVTLRDSQPEDVPALFAFENDPAWRTMAMVKPRTREAFAAVWEKVFEDRAAGAAEDGVVHKVILANGEVCGAIGCRRVEDHLAVGYGLGQAYWGRGIASRALALLLEEVKRRPLRARAAASNAASIRVLLNNGFVIEGRQASPETERYVACEDVRMVLR